MLFRCETREAMLRHVTVCSQEVPSSSIPP